MRTVIVDFETFYDKKTKYSLRHLSYPEYIYDSRFKVHGMGVQIDGEEPQMVWAEDIEDFLPTIEDDILVFHNGYFDLAVLAWKYGFNPAWIMDTLSLANHVLGSAREMKGQKNDLASLGERLGVPVKKGDLSFADGVVDLDDGERAAMDVYVKRDLLVTRGVLDVLLPQVSNPDFELWLADHTLRIFTDKPLPINVEMVKKTQELCRTRMAERRDAAGVDPKVLASNKQFVEELTKRLKAAGLEVPMKKSPTTGKTIPALAKSDPGFMALTQPPTPLPIIDLIRGRLVERSGTQALSRLAKLERFNQMGGMRTHLVYYGAHTGRFAAAGGFNLQNLTSPDRAIDPVDKEIAGNIRKAIEAGVGMVFASADASQIEARDLAWLAGEDSVLEAFAAGNDIYSQFISEVTGEEIRKPKPGDSEELASKLKLWRHVGKESILGLGFGMGVDKFQTRLKDPKNPGVAAKVEDGTLSLEVCAAIVKTYREKYPNIVDFWYQLNRAFMFAKDGRQMKVGKLTFKKIGRQAVGIVLPSGRVLNYRHIRREKYAGKQAFTGMNGGSRKTREREWEWKHGSGQRIYGGLLAENVTQAVARDVIVETIQRAELEMKWDVVLHVHDEVVLRVPEADGERARDWLVKSLSTPPEWGQGMPLAAEGKIAHNLGK